MEQFLQCGADLLIAVPDTAKMPPASENGNAFAFESHDIEWWFGIQEPDAKARRELTWQR